MTLNCLRKWLGTLWDVAVRGQRNSTEPRSGIDTLALSWNTAFEQSSAWFCCWLSCFSFYLLFYVLLVNITPDGDVVSKVSTVWPFSAVCACRHRVFEALFPSVLIFCLSKGQLENLIMMWAIRCGIVWKQMKPIMVEHILTGVSIKSQHWWGDGKVICKT